MDHKIEIFCCYAHEDQGFLSELRKWLKPLKIISTWSDTDISPGADWEKEIHARLHTALIILLLVSPDFMASDYCSSVELKQAMERHEKKQAYVIPVLLRPTYLEEALFAHLQRLPTESKPVTNWPDRDAAYLDIVKGVVKVAEEWKKALEERKRLRQEQARMISLFGYETDGGTKSALWTDPINPEFDETKFQQWRDVKRAFTREEIVDHTWIKIGSHGGIYLVRFSKETETGINLENLDPFKEEATLTEIVKGRLLESPLSDPGRQWPGSWKIINGMLRLNFSTDSGYELDIFANHSEESIGSGIEFSQAQKTPFAYFTLLPLQETTAKHWLLDDVPALVERIFEQILERPASQSELIAYGSLLHRGEMSVRILIKILGCSREYRQRFIDTETVDEALELCYKHFLGRNSDSLGRAFYPEWVKIRGFNWLTHRITDSDEYVNQKFGEDKIPSDAITCLTAVSMYPGHLECFYRGANNSLWHRYWYSPEMGGTGEWSEEHNLGGFLTSAPAAISTKPHHIDCFYRSKDNHLYQRHWNGEKKRWSDEVDLGGFLTSAPTVASWGPDRLDCFYRGADNCLWHRWWESKSGWSDGENRGGSLASAPSAVSWAPDRINCIYRGTDSCLWEKWSNGKSWKREHNFEMILNSTPAITSRKPDYLDYFYRGRDNGLRHRRWSTKNNGWGNEENLGGFLTSAPAAVSWGPSRVDCFYCGQGNHLWHQWWDGERWNRVDLGQLQG